MTKLPDNLISEQKQLAAIVAKAENGQSLNHIETKVVARYQKEADEVAAYTYVTSQLDLAREIGCDPKTISRRIQSGRSPGKDKEGYCVQKWQAFIAPESERFSEYAEVPSPDASNSAEIHQNMLKKAAELHAKLEKAESNGDLGAIDIFEKRWLAVSKTAKDFENLIQRHDLEIGETIRVSDMEQVEFKVIQVLLEVCNRFIDEFAIVAAGCEGEREIRQKAESVFERIGKSTFDKAFRGEFLDERAHSIFARALGISTDE